MDKFFSFFGKMVLVLIFLGGIAYGAYRLGTSSAPASNPGAVSTTAMPTPTIDIGLLPEKKPEGMKTKTIKAGLGADSGLSFTKYQITIPTSWTPLHQTENEGWMDVLTLSKGAAKLTISQGATGGAMCMYPGDPAFEGPSSSYDSFVVITTADGIILHRGTTNINNGTTKGYTMCQKSTDSFGQPTVFGHMSLITALNADPSVLTEVDTMISSLKKL